MLIFIWQTNIPPSIEMFASICKLINIYITDILCADWCWYWLIICCKEHHWSGAWICNKHRSGSCNTNRGLYLVFLWLFTSKQSLSIAHKWLSCALLVKWMCSFWWLWRFVPVVACRIWWEYKRFCFLTKIVIPSWSYYKFSSFHKDS